MGSNYLVVGGGGREHCLAWGLARSEAVERVYVAPGNGGTAGEPKCTNVPISPFDFEGLIHFAREKEIAVAVVGPEAPLAAGLVDALRTAGITAFGPDRAGARIEASKAWAKELMEDAGVPTAGAVIFGDLDRARDYLRATPGAHVVKADGLAQGKGVTVALDSEEALAALDGLARFGDAGQTVVIEEKLEGEEASVLAFVDGRTFVTMPAAQDHKRIGAGDTGPNTGGMGAYAPAPLVTPALMARVGREIFEPILDVLAAQGVDYRGVLYAGLMIEPDGTPKVIEFNCRFGDPETQVLVPLLATPLAEVVTATAAGRLAEISVEWRTAAAACVVIAAGGYPGNYNQGDEITGLAEAVAEGALLFHSGTRRSDDGRVFTSGGRVLSVSAVDATLAAALGKAYSAVGKIDFADAYHRPDIGWRARSR